MKTLTDRLNEILRMPLSYGKRKWYHGVQEKRGEINSGQLSGEAILREGVIKGVNKEFDPVYGVQPLKDRVYLTSSLCYAVEYAIGPVKGYYRGDHEESYRYVFVVGKEELEDVLPDEDELGDLYFKILNKKEREEAIEGIDAIFYNKINKFVDKKSLSSLWRKEVQSELGKKVLHNALLDDELLCVLLGQFENVSNHGPVSWEEAWKIDYRKSGMVKEDCSNFFEIAERVA